MPSATDRTRGPAGRCARGALLAALAVSCPLSLAAPGLASAPPRPPAVALAPALAAAAVAEPPRSADRRVRSIASRLAGHRTGLRRPAVDRLARTLVREANRRGFEPELVLAVMKVESSFYNYAISRAGAYGLMQILPSTGEALARRLGIEWSGEETLFDPIANVRLGIAYLEQLRNRYGHLPTALAAYNWGPTRIDRRLDGGDSLPGRYVGKVFDAYAEQLRLGREARLT